MLRIRQLALVARDLEPVVEDLCAVLGVPVCFRDPGVATFGLHNALLPVGTTFLEVVSPREAGTSAGRLLDRMGGDGGYMVILQTDDLAAARARARERGARVVWEIALDDIATVHLHPRDVGGAIVSLDESTPAAEWRWAGPDWRRLASTAVVSAIRVAEVCTHDPQRLAARWADLFGGPIEPSGDGFVWPLEESAVRFLPARDREGLTAIGFEAPGCDAALAAARARGLPVDGDSVTIAGTRLDFQRASGD